MNWEEIKNSEETEHLKTVIGTVEYRIYNTARFVDSPIDNEYMIEKHDTITEDLGMINKDGKYIFGWGMFNACGPHPECVWKLEKEVS